MNNLTKSQLRLASGSSSVDNYTKTAAQKAALGSPAEKYQTALDNYNKNQGTMSDITKYSTNKSLAKLKVNAPYSNDVVSLYGMSKTEALKYLSTETKGVDKKSLYDQLLAYDKALVAAGINKTLKFSGSNSTKKSGSGSKTSTLAAATAAITANNAARSATKKFKMSAAPTATATLKKQAQTPLKKYATAKHSVDLRKLANLV